VSPAAIAPLAFVALAGLIGAVGLAWYARRAAAAARLRRRLGTLAPAGELVRDEAPGLERALHAAIARLRSARRIARCDAQMPQALDVIALALRAGHALPGALALAADEVAAPLGHELRRACDEHQLGRPLGEVIAGMAARLPGAPTVEAFVVADAVLQETGGNLIEVIERIAETARARAAYRARLRALTAEGRQSARLLAGLPGAFLVLALVSDPGYAGALLTDRGGRTILALAVGLWVIGVAWTRRLVRPLDPGAGA
jgi:tight adherence protein B